MSEYVLTVTKTITYSLEMSTADLLELAADVTGKPFVIDPEADEADQLFDLFADSSEILQRVINHPDTSLDEEQEELTELSSND